MNNQQMRNVFEHWYTDQALATGDTTPLGSRSCALQWAAWQAALSQPAPQGVAEMMELVDLLLHEQLSRVAASEYLGGEHYGEVKRAITALVQERDAWKERYLQLTAQTARAEDRAENAESERDALKARLAELEVNYHELLYAVAHKHPDETRHQTALRYIMRAEKAHGSDGAGAASSKEAP